MNYPTRKETLNFQGLFSCYIALWRDGLPLFSKDTAFEIANAVGSFVYTTCINNDRASKQSVGLYIY